MTLTSAEKQFLLSSARLSLEKLFDKTIVIEIPDDEEMPTLFEEAGAFVTLWYNEKLRGCIGFVLPQDTIFQTVLAAAELAATQDPRFPPVKEYEINDINIEISVLSPPFPIKSYDDIVLGEHGLILKEGNNSGLLLPQVPIEHSMNRDEYLTALCKKAGLPGNHWQQKKLFLQAFTATVFEEE